MIKKEEATHIKGQANSSQLEISRLCKKKKKLKENFLA